MLNSDFVCKYHLDRNAVDKCESCGAFVCLKCKKTYPEAYTGSYRRRAYTLCPLCFFEKKEKVMSSPSREMIWIFMGFTVFMMGMAVVMGSMLVFAILKPNHYLEILDLIFQLIALTIPVGVFIIASKIFRYLKRYYFIIGPQEVEEAKNQRENFLVSLDSTEFLKEESRKY